MLILNNRPEYLVCDDVKDIESAKRQVAAGLGILDKEEITIFYNILARYPKILIQNSPTHSKHLYKEENKITLLSKTEQGINSKLDTYADRYIIVDFVCFTKKRHIKIELYRLEDFLHINKLPIILRKQFIDDILKDI